MKKNIVNKNLNQILTVSNQPADAIIELQDDCGNYISWDSLQRFLQWKELLIPEVL